MLPTPSPDLELEAIGIEDWQFWCSYLSLLLFIGASLPSNSTEMGSVEVYLPPQYAAVASKNMKWAARVIEVSQATNSPCRLATTQ